VHKSNSNWYRIQLNEPTKSRSIAFLWTHHLIRDPECFCFWFPGPAFSNNRAARRLFEANNGQFNIPPSYSNKYTHHGGKQSGGQILALGGERRPASELTVYYCLQCVQQARRPTESTKHTILSSKTTNSANKKGLQSEIRLRNYAGCCPVISADTSHTREPPSSAGECRFLQSFLRTAQRSL